MAKTIGVSSTTVASRLSTAVDHRAEHDDEAEQGRGAAARPLGQPLAGGLEEAGPGGEVAEHQHRGQEGHRRADVVELVARLAQRDHARRQEQQGRGGGEHDLRQPAGPHHGEGQGRDEAQEGEGFGHVPG